MSKFFRLPRTLDETGLKRSTLHELVAAGQFPKPVRIGPRAVAWIEEEITAWKKARIAERDAGRKAAR